MGEIATWSAVKSRIGLGKDGNDCPTKAELLALTPTGTGESYKALELSNKSSYGDNECVQLLDTHQITYRYTFTAGNPQLNFPADGGRIPLSSLEVLSYKAKYRDSIYQGPSVEVFYDMESNPPEWLKFVSGSGYYEVEENTSTESRSTVITLIQFESGKTIDIPVLQEAAEEKYEYTFIVSLIPPGGTFQASGGSQYLEVASFRRKLINGVTSGTSEAVPFDYSQSGDTTLLVEISRNTIQVTADENKSIGIKDGTITFTQEGSGKTELFSWTQAAGEQTYGEIEVVTQPTVDDIPASGGTLSQYTSGPGIRQPWGWNGKTDSGYITEPVSITMSEPVSAPSLGSTIKNRTQIGTLYCTITGQGGKIANVEVPIYQGANQVEFVDITSPRSFSISSPSGNTFSASEGSKYIRGVIYFTEVSTYTSNYKVSQEKSEVLSSSTATLTITNGDNWASINTELNPPNEDYCGRLTVVANSNTSERSCNIQGTYTRDGITFTSNILTLTQAAREIVITYEYDFKLSKDYPVTSPVDSLSLSIPNTGGQEGFFIVSNRVKYIDGVASSVENVSFTSELISGTRFTTFSYGNEVDGYGQGATTKASENDSSFNLTENTTFTQEGSGKTVQLTVTQPASIITFEYIFEWA